MNSYTAFSCLGNRSVANRICCSWLSLTDCGGFFSILYAFPQGLLFRSLRSDVHALSLASEIVSRSAFFRVINNDQHDLFSSSEAFFDRFILVRCLLAEILSLLNTAISSFHQLLLSVRFFPLLYPITALQALLMDLISTSAVTCPDSCTRIALMRGSLW